MNKLTNPIDIYVDGSQPIKLVGANALRRAINIWAGTTDLWYGDRNITAGSQGNKIMPGIPVEIAKGAEVWVIRESGNAGACAYSEEF